MKKPEEKHIHFSSPLKKLKFHTISELHESKAAKRTVAAAVAAAASLSILSGSVSHDPGDMAVIPDDSHLVPIVQMLEEPEPENETSVPVEITDPEEEKRRTGLLAKIRAFLLRMPISARICLCLPLWAAGGAVLWTVSGGSAAIPAAVHSLARMFVLAAASAAVFVGSTKIIVPDLSLKKILTGRNLLVLALIALAAEILLLLMRLLIKDGEIYVKLFYLLIVFAALLCFQVLYLRREKRRGPEEEEKA